MYRMARALVLQFIAGCGCALSTITLDLDHTDDATYVASKHFLFTTPFMATIATCLC